MFVASKNKVSIGIFLVVVSVGVLTALLGEASLKIVLLTSIATFGVAYCSNNFEKSILGLLIVRSALDLFTARQIPAIYGVGVEALALLCVVIQILRGGKLHIDKFWFIFMSWTILQGMWLIFMLLGSLGFDSLYLSESLREWVRLLLWPSIYLLVMQLKDKVSPQKVITAMLFSLPFPLLTAIPQLKSGSLRISASFAHANAFASFLLLFMGIVWWKLNHCTKTFRWFWIGLLGVLAFFLISTKALFVLMMFLICILVIIVPKISINKLITGSLVFALLIGIFSSSEYGQSRLESIINTPLANPEISVSRGILLSESDHNSFNWRLSQWNTVLKAWEKHPFLGYGLGMSKEAINSKLLPHNDYIRALAEGGVVGLSTYIGLFGFFLFRAVQMYSTSINSSQKDMCLVIIAILIATLVGMISENIWSHTVFFFYLSSLMAIADWDWGYNPVQKREDATVTA